VARLALIVRVLIAEPAIAREHLRVALLNGLILAVPMDVHAGVDDCAPGSATRLGGALIECHEGDDDGQGAYDPSHVQPRWVSG
jgi:hypothetical protein